MVLKGNDFRNRSHPCFCHVKLRLCAMESEFCAVTVKGLHHGCEMNSERPHRHTSWWCAVTRCASSVPATEPFCCRIELFVRLSAAPQCSTDARSAQRYVTADMKPVLR